MAVLAEFEKRYIPDDKLTAEAGHLKHREEEWVQLHIDGSTIIEKRVDDKVRAEYRDYYEAWKNGEEMPVNGFDLREWPAINKGSCEQARKKGIFSVEQLSKCEDNELQFIQQGRLLKQKAIAWLEASNDSGKAAEKLRTQEKLIESQGEKIDALMAQVSALQAEIEGQKVAKRPAKKADSG